MTEPRPVLEPLSGTMTLDKVRQWRKARGLTQSNLAALLGLSRSAYIYIEKGDPRRQTESRTVSRMAELALLGLDREMWAAFDPKSPAELRDAYAKALRNIAATSQPATDMRVASANQRRRA